jgi:hypothetical protein
MSPGPGGGEFAPRRERNFGPPAPPKGKRTSQGKGRGAELGPKGPIKVRGGNRVFDVDDPAVDAVPAAQFDDFATSLPEGAKPVDEAGDE